MYDIEKIEKEYKKLKCPSEFWKPRLDKLFSNDFYMCLSLRQDNGKTLNSLLIGLIIYKLYGYTTAYIRSDVKMITRANVSRLYDMVCNFNYINKIFPDYDGVRYDALKRAFYLIHRNELGEIDKEETKPFCEVFCLEKWVDYKSGYNNPMANFLIYDEFMDTDRYTGNQITELQNLISTITRLREDSHVLMLANNTNKYSFWFDEFTIKDDIELVGYGSHFEKKTELGTTIYCELLALTEKRKDLIEQKKIRFFGFNTPKMAQFTGVATWQGYNFPHCEIEVDYQELIGFIKHRGQVIAIYVIGDNIHKPQILFTKFNTIKRKDLPVFTLHPTEENETIIDNIYKFVKVAMNEKRFCFSANNVGLLLDDFMKESGIKIKLY